MQSVEDRVRDIEQRMADLYNDAEIQGIKHVDRARIAKEWLAAATLIGRLTGELRDGGTTNDNRIQIAHFEALQKMSTDELRAMLSDSPSLQKPVN